MSKVFLILLGISVLIALYILLLGKNKTKYDHYVLAFEFPGSVCKLKNCSKEFMGNLKSDSINLHGLWPNIGDGQGPFECGPNIYSDDAVSPSVMARMNSNFVGVYNSSASFRSHEYGKHGTCFDYQSNLPSFIPDNINKLDIFFTKALDELDKYSLKELYKAKDMNAGFSTFSYKEIESIATAKYGKNGFQVFCSKNTKIEEYYLNEFYVCLDLKFNSMVCPNYQNHQTDCPLDKEIRLYKLDLIN